MYIYPFNLCNVMITDFGQKASNGQTIVNTRRCE